MPSPEHRPERRHTTSEPLHPSPLLPDLAEYLRDTEYACVPEPSDHGTVFVIKVPNADIPGLAGQFPILLRHELYQHPAAPVIRTVITLIDQPQQPLALESFTNIEDEQQRTDFAALANQETLYLLIYDDGLRHRLTKAVSDPNHEAINEIVEEADRLLAAIPDDQVDFDRAKAAVMEATRL